MRDEYCEYEYCEMSIASIDYCEIEYCEYEYCEMSIARFARGIALRRATRVELSGATPGSRVLCGLHGGSN